jgi:S-adenosyl methyltransferase
VVVREGEKVEPGSRSPGFHAIWDLCPEATQRLADLYQDEKIVRGVRRHNIRSRAEVEPYFDGLDLVEPGIVQVPAWRPDVGEPSVDPRGVWSIAGVGRKS